MVAKARIAVIGSGLMGHGIAQVFALAGHDITITDAHRPTLDSALTRISTNLRDLGDDEKAVSRVRPVPDMADCVRDADYVVEAILEDMPLKQKTAYEIIAGDWSSDVCSSDLGTTAVRRDRTVRPAGPSARA